MNDYHSIFDAVPWGPVGVSALQTFVVYWVAMLGLKLVGRRAFGELGPQDVVLLLLLSEGLNQAMVHPGGGFWAGIASALVLLGTVAITERITAVREAIDGRAVEVVRDGRPVDAAMARFRLDLEDLMSAARSYGVAGPEAFERMVLEGDGSLTGVLKPEHRAVHPPDVKPV